MQRQNQYSNAGSSQGYSSYGNAGVSHLPPGYSQPLGAGRPREHMHPQQHHSPSPSPHPGSHGLNMSTYARGASPTPQQAYQQQQQSSYAPQQSYQQASYAPQQTQQQQSSYGHHLAQERSQQQQQHSGMRTVADYAVTSQYDNRSQQYENRSNVLHQATSAANSAAHQQMSERQAYQHQLSMAPMYDPRRELQNLGMGTQERGERRQEQLQTLALNSHQMVDRVEGQHRRDQITEQIRQVEQMRQIEHDTRQRQQQQQQQMQQMQQAPVAPATQVSNSMSIRELASLVGHLPPHADPFPLIHDTLRSHSDEPTAHTTLMIRNIPTKYTQRLFLREIKAQGFDKCIDFLYLPSDSRGKGNVGYGFINFVTTGFLSEFKKEFSELKFRQYTSQQPLTIIMSTTQGWRENLVKVIRNCVLKRQIAPEFLPLLFCRSTGQEYPFPIPSSATPNNTPPASPAPSDGVPSKSPSAVNLDGDFDYASENPNGSHGISNRGIGLSANAAAARGRSRSKSLADSDNNSVRDRSASANTADSWESQKRAVEADPLNAFAGNADGVDALGFSELRKKHQQELSAHAQSFSYAGNILTSGIAPTPATSSTGFKLGNADVAAFVPSAQMGRYKTQSTEHTYESASVGNSENSWNDSHMGPATTGIQKCKAKDFYAHHGLTVDLDDHTKQVALRKKDVSCTGKEKEGTIKMPKFPITNPNGKGKGKGKGGCVYYDMANSKGKGKGGKSLAPNATASRATSAITSRMQPEIMSPIRSQSAKDFCEIDVLDFHMTKFQTTLAQAQSDSEQDNAFNAAVFSSHLFAPRDDCSPSVQDAAPVLNRMWSDASVAMVEMVKGIRAGHGDVCGETPSESFDSQSESGRVPLFARTPPAEGTPDLMSLASTPVRATTPILAEGLDNINNKGE